MYIKSDEPCPQLLLVCPLLVFIAQVLCTHMSHSVQEIQSMTSAASVVLYWSSLLKQMPHISVSVSCNSVCVCCVSLSDGLPSLSVIVFRLFFVEKKPGCVLLSMCQGFRFRPVNMSFVSQNNCSRAVPSRRCTFSNVLVFSQVLH